ncbi:hypothetical protein GCM10010208_74730 [Actinomadura livida]|nr:hypothetical protein GCM10010208_74730 [Actinomadura livida]
MARLAGSTALSDQVNGTTMRRGATVNGSFARLEVTSYGRDAPSTGVVSATAELAP